MFYAIIDYQFKTSERKNVEKLAKQTFQALKNLTHPVCIARSRSTHALHSPFSGPPKIRVL